MLFLTRTGTNTEQGSTNSLATEVTPVSSAGSNQDHTHIRGDGRCQILSKPVNTAYETCCRHFHQGEHLGGGHFGEVYKGTLHVAIKKANTTAMSKKSLEQELKILTHLGAHKNVVRLLSYAIDNNGMFQNNGCGCTYKIRKFKRILIFPVF